MSDHKNAPLAGVIGWPIAHSRSPQLHGHWLRRYGIKGWYVPLPVSPKDFDSALRALPKMGFVGANVTIPHKARALELADQATPMARALRAANTLTFDADGGIHADNTDGFGFIENLRGAKPDWDAATSPTVVFGAGGASRAVIAALLEAGVPKLRLTNRTREKAEALRDDIDPRIEVIDWADAEGAAEGASLLVNATSMGMEGGPPLRLSLSGIGHDALATDLVYAPLDTPFLKLARGQGAVTVDGLGMLLHQARPGFRAWFGREPEVDEELRRAVLA